MNASAGANSTGLRASELINAIGPVWIAVIGLYILSGILSPAMFQPSQVLNILQVAAFVGVIACGQTLVLLIGGIDLSQAGTVTLINIVATSLMLGSDANIAVAVLTCLGLAIAIGLGNALLIVVLRVTPLIATLSTNSILFGAALIYTGGAPHGAAAPAFNWLGQGNISGIPVSTLCWLLVALVLAWLTRATVYGRWLYATGANPVAARLMGVPTRSIQASAYVVSALTATLTPGRAMPPLPVPLTSRVSPPRPATVEAWCRQWAQAMSHRNPDEVASP